MKHDPSAEVPPSDEALCSYKSRKCPNPRAVKRNGCMHTLCEYHRARQNEHQRKSDRKHKGSKHARQLMKQCGTVQSINTSVHFHGASSHDRAFSTLSMHVSPAPSTTPDGLLYGNLFKEMSFVEAFELHEALRAVTASPGLM
ncbi:hypothetical protein H310_01269 [Aphanomyces invadans]|uniref:Uncharacterized protein n=1 Tax=Aphanomyces invadans TaxID=157072 RepID=A0A024UQL5_9STRA|nr:hypothetical protein H310_01269 [Aphanomyces invadans]ETW08751.1 hypothetical protein H310_01269 [Aphanomyces invadans]|eukprot:XP_008862556.1 hypothetical protein H310_01269 [Aphanomyces invadans]